MFGFLVRNDSVGSSGKGRLAAHNLLLCCLCDLLFKYTLNMKAAKNGKKDGGFWYWHIEYDIQKGECLNFYSNGEA